MKTNHIYNENCLDTMKRMEDNFIDLTVTSPPYDDIRDYKGYSFPFEEIVKELFRVTKEGGIVVWVVGDATTNGSETGTSFKQALYFMECGFRLHDTMIYGKNNPMPTAGDRYQQQFEYMFVFSKGKPKTFNPKMEKSICKGTSYIKNRGKKGDIEGYRLEPRTESKKVGNIFFYSIGGGLSTKDKIAFQHPAIFPEKLVEDHILTWSNREDLVYDTFMGSGTTAKMCVLNGRRFIGSEMSSDYCEIIEERLSLLVQYQLNKSKEEEEIISETREFSLNDLFTGENP